MLDIILTRRSIRKYKNTPVSESDIKKLLEAAMAAPSAGNSQPWEFIIINDRKILDEIPKFHPYSQMLKEAPLAIVVCGDLKKEKYRDRWPLDCSAAAQNILLAAHSLGLGTVWLGIYPEKERIDNTVNLLRIPQEVIPLCIIAVGYPDEIKPPSHRYKEENIHFNKF